MGLYTQLGFSKKLSQRKTILFSLSLICIFKQQPCWQRGSKLCCMASEFCLIHTRMMIFSIIVTVKILLLCLLLATSQGVLTQKGRSTQNAWRIQGGSMLSQTILHKPVLWQVKERSSSILTDTIIGNVILLAWIKHVLLAVQKDS